MKTKLMFFAFLFLAMPLLASAQSTAFQADGSVFASWPILSQETWPRVGPLPTYVLKRSECGTPIITTEDGDTCIGSGWSELTGQLYDQGQYVDTTVQAGKSYVYYVDVWVIDSPPFHMHRFQLPAVTTIATGPQPVPPPTNLQEITP